MDFMPPKASETVKHRGLNVNHLRAKINFNPGWVRKLGGGSSGGGGDGGCGGCDGGWGGLEWRGGGCGCGFGFE